MHLWASSIVRCSTNIIKYKLLQLQHNNDYNSVNIIIPKYSK